MELKIIVFFQFQHPFSYSQYLSPPFPSPIRKKKLKPSCFAGSGVLTLPACILYILKSYEISVFFFCFSLLYYLQIFALEYVFDNTILMVNWLHIIIVD